MRDNNVSELGPWKEEQEQKILNQKGKVHLDISPPTLPKHRLTLPRVDMKQKGNINESPGKCNPRERAR